MFLTLNDFEENIKDSNFTGDFNKEQIKRIRAHLLRFRDARDLLSSSLFKSWYKLLSPEQRLSIKFEMNENTYVTLLQTILEGLFPSASLLHPHFAPSSLQQRDHGDDPHSRHPQHSHRQFVGVGLLNSASSCHGDLHWMGHPPTRAANP